MAKRFSVSNSSSGGQENVGSNPGQDNSVLEQDALP